MKKTLFSLALVASMATSAFAQEADLVPAPQSNWKVSGITGANTAQTALVNWSAGGENSVAWNVYLNATANYKKDKWSWDNALVTDFGMAVLPCSIIPPGGDATEGSDIFHTAHVTSTHAHYQCEISP